MNDQEFKASYELAKILETTRHKLFDAEKCLERLERLEVLLRMWMNDTDACKTGSAFFDDDRSSSFRIGYQEARLIAFSILCDNDCEATRKYKEMLNAPE